jgi:hypothetical protein
MNLYWIPNIPAYVGTQAEAKASGHPWEAVDVPTDKPNLISYLNELLLITHADAVLSVVAQPVKQPLAQQTIHEFVPPPARSGPSELVEKITESTGTEFGSYFVASIERLAELRNNGWNDIAKLTKHHTFKSSLERGLGALFLGLAEAQIDKES